VRHDVRVFGKLIGIETLNKLFSGLFYFKRNNLKETVSISSTCNTCYVFLDLYSDETRYILLLLRCLLC